ncbi:unnamed protein product [Durusdinium trenchii]|uniref:Uncharacterized protein n=1 Tax=Durusdinium trenchii TaxID=1381693 RepID=A0ABP0MA26_9DINO
MAFFHRFLPLLLTQSMLFTVATRARHENRESMFPRVLARTAPRLFTLANRRASNGGQMSKEAFEDFLASFMTYSAETNKKIVQEAMKGPGRRAYEAVRRAYRPSPDVVEKIFASYGRGPKGAQIAAEIMAPYGRGPLGQKVANEAYRSIRRSHTGRGVLQDMVEWQAKREYADELLLKIQARVPIIEAGGLVKRVWTTPIPPHLKKLVEAGKYGKGAEAEKVLTESMNFIAKGAGLFLGVGLASQGVDGLEALDAEPEPGSLGSDEEFETRTEDLPKSTALETLALEPSVEHAKEAAEELQKPTSEVLASTLTYWMDQAIQLGAAGDEEAEAVAEDGAMANFLQGMRQAVASLSEEELKVSQAVLDELLEEAKGIVDSADGMDLLLETEEQLEDYMDPSIPLEVEDLSKMEDVE